MSKFILGVGGFFHDFNVALLDIDTGEYITAEEERFSRIKHHPILGIDHTSIDSINYCLQFMEADPSNIVQVVYSDLQAHPVQKQLSGLFPQVTVSHIHHHYCHAAAAYYCSGSSHAAVLTLDGWGDNCSGMLLEGRDYSLNMLVEIPHEHSIAMEYLRATHWLGLGTFGAEGKTQGLAPYGKPVYLDDYLKEIDFHEDGSYQFSSRLRSMDGYLSGDHYMGYKHLYNDFLNDVLPRRFADEPLTAEHHNLAASIQRVLEVIALHCASALQNTTQSDTLVISGGAGLNSSMNAALENSGLYKTVYAHPSASDRGNALGAILHYVNHDLDTNLHYDHPLIYTGQSFTNEEILKSLRSQQGLHYEKLNDPSVTAAELLASNAIIGWFQGRSELGARALGNRSILAHPGYADNKAQINERVKHREGFRPFAPSVLFEHAHEWFETEGRAYPYMTKTLRVTPRVKSRIPAVTHVDGTARVQTVAEQQNPLYHRLINVFYQRTQIPLVLNTSFNDAGEPIVETPIDAINSFMRCDIDYLILGSYLVRKL